MFRAFVSRVCFAFVSVCFERLLAADAEPGGGSPEQLGQAVAAEVAKWTRLVRERNLRFDP